VTGVLFLGAGSFLFPVTFRTALGTTSYSVVTGCSFPKFRSQSMNLTTYLHIILMPRMCGTLPLPCLYIYKKGKLHLLYLFRKRYEFASHPENGTLLELNIFV
jgi:hypothetical protein